jgi:hypothetical protein
LRDFLEPLQPQHSRPNITRAIKSRIIRWAGHEVRREIGEVQTEFWWEDLTKGDHLEDLGVDKNMILKLIFKKYDGGVDWIKLAFRTGTGGEFL